MTCTVLILGAAGRIGGALTSAFAEAGWRVRAHSRKPLPPAGQHPNVQAVHCDALDAPALQAAARGADVVVHALNAPYTQWDRWALPLAEAAIAAAQHSGALLMLPGNVYNFGRALPAILTPAAAERGDTPKARLRIETEARMAATPGLDSVVIRAGDFFGSGQRGSWFDLALVSRLAAGKFIYPGDAHVEHAWAYLPDLAQVFVRVAQQRAALHGHRRFHYAGHTVTGQDMKRALEHARGRPLRLGGMPWGWIRLGAWAVPLWRELLTMRYLWQRPHRLEDHALADLIGPLPHTPLAVAMAQSLRRLDAAQSPAASFSASARA